MYVPVAWVWFLDHLAYVSARGGDETEAVHGFRQGADPADIAIIRRFLDRESTAGTIASRAAAQAILAASGLAARGAPGFNAMSSPAFYARMRASFAAAGDA